MVPQVWLSFGTAPLHMYLKTTLLGSGTDWMIQSPVTETRSMELSDGKGDQGLFAARKRTEPHPPAIITITLSAQYQ